MARLPSNSVETMVAYQWRPSPSSVMCSQDRPAWMMDWSSSAVMTSASNLVADAQQVDRNRAHHQPGAADDGQAHPGRDVADPEEAVAEAVDHVEEGVQVA